ncbi:MAG: hypothetical protein M1832_002044 [Thelocarpon impressellum]|nr:MAG: hypothetical protein M1832_002044 [Thelocarpon impressellum]
MITLHSTTALILMLLVPLLSCPALAETTPSDDAGHPLQICDPADPTLCYPRVFSPTVDFQPVLEGQEIPPGLHVRLDVSTGKKEARLNVPSVDEGTADTEAVFVGDGWVFGEDEEGHEPLGGNDGWISEGSSEWGGLLTR